MTEHMNLSIKQKQTHRHREQTYGRHEGGGQGEMDSEFGMTRCKVLYIRDKQGPTV